MRRFKYLFAILIIVAACNKNNNDNNVTPPREVPTPPTQPNLTVTCNEKVNFESIPQAAQDLVNKNFPNFSITEVEVCTDSDGNTYYEVEVEKGNEEYDIYFDGNGEFISMKDDSDGAGTSPPTRPTIPPNPGNEGTPETVRCDIDFNYDNLPSPVKDFISTYYSNFQIDDVDVCKDGNGNIVAYEIELEQGDSEFWLYFDSDGNFLIAFDKFGNNSTEPPNSGNITPPGGGSETQVYCGAEISQNELPQSILTHVATNFPGKTIDDVEVCYDENGILAYDLELEGGGEIHAFYDKEGNFLGTSEDDFDGDDNGGDVCTTCQCDDCDGDNDDDDD